MAIANTSRAPDGTIVASWLLVSLVKPVVVTAATKLNRPVRSMSGRLLKRFDAERAKMKITSITADQMMPALISVSRKRDPTRPWRISDCTAKLMLPITMSTIRTSSTKVL